VAIFFGFIALSIWNTLCFWQFVIVLRRSGEYAFVRPGREMLWTPNEQGNEV
jgi:AAA family ATP:ADP antiporter